MKNRFKTDGDVTTVYVTRKNGDKYEVLISTADIPKLEGWSICVQSWNGQVRATVSRSTYEIYGLHRFLTDAPKGYVVDHINHNALDNRQSNLRVITHSQNMQNRRGATKRSKSGVRGVVWEKNNKNWCARCKAAGKYHFVGAFQTLEEAEAAVKAFRAAHMPYSEEALLKNENNSD